MEIKKITSLCWGWWAKNEIKKEEKTKEEKTEIKEGDGVTKEIKNTLELPYHIEYYRRELEEKLKEIKDKEKIKEKDLWDIHGLAKKAEDERYERIAYEALLIFYNNEKEEDIDEIYKRMIDRWPDDVEIMTEYTKSLIKRKKYKEAREMVEVIKQKGGYKGLIYSLTGDIYLGEEDTVNAKKYYKMALDCNPFNEKTEEKYINILISEGETEKAEEEKERLEKERNRIEKETEEAYERRMNHDW